MSDLRDLYQEVIFDHNRHPRNFRKLEGANRTARGYNPLCGDKLTVYLIVDGEGVIREAAFEGTGCAISMASASLMTEALKGRREEEADALFEGFHELVTSPTALPTAELGKLVALGGVRDYPARVKCATLAWHAAHTALHEPGKEAVSTE
jgi:nitrogen fixation protein NifU and related proteins